MLKQISFILLHCKPKFPQLVRHVCQSTNRIQGLMMMKKSCRSFHTCRKKEHVARNSCSRKVLFSNILFHTEIGSFVYCGNRQSYETVTCMFYSSMKDDEIVKSWVSEIQDDFEKESKAAVKDKNEKIGKSESSGEIRSSENCDSVVEDTKKTNTDDLHNDIENDISKLEKQGFTTEEIIDLLKSAKKLDEKLIEDEYELSDSESENEQSGEQGESLNTGENTRNEKNQSDGQKGTEVGSTNKMEKEEWAVVKMKPDVKTHWSVVEIEDFVNFAEAESDIEDAWKPPVDLVRGKTGVYDIEDLITVLRAANAQDLLTIRVPSELDFADYMVIASAKSLRHIQAITSDVNWIYKKKKHKSDMFIKVEGEKSDWYAIDLGNIVLHIFMPAVRELYDLETLWTAGVKFDPQSTEEPNDPYVFSVDDLPWLKELEQAPGNLDQSQNQAPENVGKSTE